MPNTFLNRLETRSSAAGIEKGTREALDWFRKEIKTIRAPRYMKQVLRDDNLIRKSLPQKRSWIGRMFMYMYDPKGKETLPYYDRFPLIFLIGEAKGGFYGINLHYLPPKIRAIFFDRLTEYTNNDDYDETTRLRLRYSFLKRNSQLRYFKPCFKHYLGKHVTSRIVEVPSKHWESVLFLPHEPKQFAKVPSSKVWQDSKKYYT
jgi:hypothetical protein